MHLPLHKTKIVCTIGPSSDTIEKIIQLINAGMSVARLNYSHGGFETHALTITMLRKASEVCKRSISILADLPGPKMRVGKLGVDSIWLETRSKYILTAEEIIGDE
ncbi:MAG: pyruvate kinase, partial [Candidatus Cloacimonetes bacterium]|nr:pyruvate kinase [Candidatus Cloacimonadota bacterium]